MPGLWGVKLDPDYPLGAASQRLLESGSEIIETIESYQMSVYRIDASVDVLTVLRPEPGVDFVSPAFQEPQAGPDMIFVSNRFVAQFKALISRATIDAYNADYQVEILQELGYLQNAYLMKASKTSPLITGVDGADVYYESGLTVFADPDLIRRHYSRSSQADAPLG
jgi:hypothetical protein